MRRSKFWTDMPKWQATDVIPTAAQTIGELDQAQERAIAILRSFQFDRQASYAVRQYAAQRAAQTQGAARG